LIARQIDKLTLIFSAEMIFRYIVPISIKLCNDSVAFVREEAARKVHSLLMALNNAEDVYKEAVIFNIQGFANSGRYTNRQT
jgi:serine/threonine-protein phosphatase 4 regulatory subunit 1